MVPNYTWITIKEIDDWIIDYDKNKGRYRISYFEDGHFKDEIIFKEYKKMNNEIKDIYIECPHCQVCSIKVTADEYTLLKTGQQMIEVCQVCGKEVNLDECIK